MNRKIKILFAFIMFISIVHPVLSQVPTYTLTATNFNRTAPDSLTFEIYLLNTNPEIGPFQYPAGQYIFRFNNAIANGGTLKYRVLASGLPQGAIPQNPTVTGNELRLASNLPVSQNNAPIISSTLPGTLVVKMSLKTSAGSFAPGQELNLTWRNSNDPPLYTKISAYVGIFIQEITTSATHYVDTTSVSINQISSIVPVEFKVFQNYPNPFNPTTNIKFDVPKLSQIKLSVYDISGREMEVLLNEKLSPGSYEFKWNAEKFSSGIYFYRIESQGFIETKRMILLK